MLVYLVGPDNGRFVPAIETYVIRKVHINLDSDIEMSNRTGYHASSCAQLKSDCGPAEQALAYGRDENDTGSRHRDANWREDLYAPPKLAASNVFCSSACALEEPVAGLAALDRFTVSTWRPCASRLSRGTTKESAPMLAGSS